MNIQCVQSANAQGYINQSLKKSPQSFGIRLSDTEISNVHKILSKFAKTKEEKDLLKSSSSLNIAWSRIRQNACPYYILQHLVDTLARMEPKTAQGHFNLTLGKTKLAKLAFNCDGKVATTEVPPILQDVWIGLDTVVKKLNN